MIPKKIKENEFIYEYVPIEQVKRFRGDFLDLLDDFSRIIDFESNLEVNEPVLSYICTRVDQRKDYYMYFHSTTDSVMHISHEKEMGLWAYWVSKYKPVRFVKKVDDQRFFLENGCTVSDAFAVYIIISIVCNSKPARAKYFTPEKVRNLYYDFSNRDFSKEAVIARIEDLIA